MPPTLFGKGRDTDEDEADDDASDISLTWTSLSRDKLRDFRAFHSVIFPVKYNEKFYQDALAAPEALVRLVYDGDLLVGVVCCRPEIGPEQNPRPVPSRRKLYIMTLGVLASYRGSGIGRALLEHILRYVREGPDVPDLTEIYLHVHVANTDAIEFYKHFGFAIKEVVPNYYKHISPPDCYYLHKVIER